MKTLQLRGNRLREEFGADAVAGLALTQVIEPYLEENQAWNARVAFIIDSLKHPHEVGFLRDVFGSAFRCVGVVASDAVRKDRLRNRKHFTDDEFAQLSRIDADEGLNRLGQKSVKTIIEADYFIANDHTTRAPLAAETQRFLRLVFGVGVETPRRNEYGMNLAARAAMRSGCLSRQVGAAILDSSGDVLATGRNDVPQAAGGLYTSDAQQDHRCWARSAYCYNDKHKSDLVCELALLVEREIHHATERSERKDIGRTKELLDDCNLERVLASSRIKSLIEFSRAVHAEMDAMLSVARSGKPGLVGATLFCTTYPCHSCARHIIAAGIAKVVYMEPYEKSLARTLHGDAISDPLQGEEPGKIPFVLYGGVAPRAYDTFFALNAARKGNDGRLLETDRRRADLFPVGAIASITLREKVAQVVRDRRDHQE